MTVLEVTLGSGVIGGEIEELKDEFLLVWVKRIASPGDGVKTNQAQKPKRP